MQWNQIESTSTSQNWRGTTREVSKSIFKLYLSLIIQGMNTKSMNIPHINWNNKKNGAILM